jgi:hypothetical protein
MIEIIHKAKELSIEQENSFFINQKPTIANNNLL